MDNQRNLLLAVALSGLLILGWDFAMRAFYPQPDTPPQTEQAQTGQAQTAQGQATPAATGSAPAAQGIEGDANPSAAPVKLADALKSADRVTIEAPRLAGSINLATAQVDDIVLRDHRKSHEKGSGPVRLFAPERTPDQYFAEFGFLAGGERLAPGKWAADGEKLTPDTPVTLTREGNDGMTYAIKFSIDEEYMLTAEQTVSNSGENAKIVQPFALINRTSKNASPDQFIAHAGPVAVSDGTLFDPHSYSELAELGSETPPGSVEWIGFTDQYWFSALVPGEGEIDKASFRSLGDTLFRSDVIYDSVTLPAGESLTQSTRLFAGAKESAVLSVYEDSGITLFGKAISWGWFEIIEKPLLWLLRTLNSLIGNFGLAIIALTFIVRGLMFPIAQKGFASMASMKAIQPKMKALQERYKDDKQKQQQEIMKLYKDEKVNPLAGCLPLLIQIPIFFALYKVLILSIEMRHEPFIPFWIKDLSAPDPWTILNLFGLLPFEATGILGIGVLAVLLGITMWLTFKLNPSAMDPMQQQIFNFMPWVLMFVMAPFAAGLLLYWVTSNILTVAQQKYLYSQHPQLRAQAEKDKAEMAKKVAREKAEKEKGNS